MMHMKICFLRNFIGMVFFRWNFCQLRILDALTLENWEFTVPYCKRLEFMPYDKELWASRTFIQYHVGWSMLTTQMAHCHIGKLHSDHRQDICNIQHSHISFLFWLIWGVIVLYYPCHHSSGNCKVSTAAAQVWSQIRSWWICIVQRTGVGFI